MATPIILFKEASPLKLKCGVARDVKVKVEPQALGKCEVKLYLTAETCNFKDGTKVMIQEIDCTDIAQSKDCTFSVSIKCESSRLMWIQLKGQATNSQGLSFEDKLTTSVNCREDETE